MLVSRPIKHHLEGEEMELTNPAQIKNISQYLLFNLVKVVQDSGVRARSRLHLFGGLGCLSHLF